MRDSKIGGGGEFSSFSFFLLSLLSAGVLGVVEEYSFLSSTPAFSISVEASWKKSTQKKK